MASIVVCASLLFLPLQLGVRVREARKLGRFSFTRTPFALSVCFRTLREQLCRMVLVFFLFVTGQFGLCK